MPFAGARTRALALTACLPDSRVRAEDTSDAARGLRRRPARALVPLRQRVWGSDSGTGSQQSGIHGKVTVLPPDVDPTANESQLNFSIFILGQICRCQDL